jgi:thiol-disulfide isomerase/thioredoxin
MKTSALLFLLLFSQNVLGQEIPDFRLVDLEGNFLTKEDLKNKYVYINVFESWCGSCATETPILNETQKNLKEVVFIALTPANMKKAKHFKEKYGFDLPIFPDADELCKKLKVKHYPTHFFIDKDGVMKEISIRFYASYQKKDYQNGRPNKDTLKKLMVEQNKTTLEKELRILMK